VLTQLENVDSGRYKYRLQATIPKKDMNVYLKEYKDEMSKRKVSFPGFRPGSLPPYVMPDVRKYLVCYGLELMIGQICNLNGLALCQKNGDNVAFGEDPYYNEIILSDFRGYDYEKQRDTWREGTDFTFAAEFFANSEGGEEEAAPSAQVIDAEIVSSE
jgi:hypothetical protein